MTERITDERLNWQKASNILRLTTSEVPRSWRWVCRHEVYFDDMVRVNDDLVVAACHKCHSLLSANCGLNLGAKLMGDRPKKCETCGGPLPGGDV